MVIRSLCGISFSSAWISRKESFALNPKNLFICYYVTYQGQNSEKYEIFFQERWKSVLPRYYYTNVKEKEKESTEWLDVKLWQFAKDLLYSESRVGEVIEKTKAEILEKLGNTRKNSDKPQF